MEADPNRSEPRYPLQDERIAALRHRHRNQTQTMTSLLGLFGRRLPAGPCRTLLEDMRVRFEAAAFDPFPESDPNDASARPIDLAGFAKQTLALLDPEFLHRVAVESGKVYASPRRAAALAQIIAELLIALVRDGFQGDAGSARLTIAAAPDGGARILLEQIGAAASRRPPAPSAVADLGLQLAGSLARNLGGRLSVEAAGPFKVEATAPPEPQ